MRVQAQIPHQPAEAQHAKHEQAEDGHHDTASLLSDIASAGGWRPYAAARRMAYVRIRHEVSKTYAVLDEGHEDASRAVSMAKAYASDAFARIGIDSVQLHGGVGYTWEYDAQLYLKRSKWARPMFGDASHHYERVAALGGL